MDVVNWLSKMRRNEPKLPLKDVEDLAENRKESIVGKCHPALFEVGPIYKESIEAFKALGSRPAQELAAKIEAKFNSDIDEVQRKYPGTIPPAPGTFAAQTIFADATNESEQQGVIEWLHFERHRVPLKVDMEKARQRDFDAFRRLLRTAEDITNLHCERPVKPFKVDLEHSNMFEVLWGFGIENLTPEELADVFDWYCPCGTEGHDPDALRKQRERFKQAIGKDTQSL
jgi:hypothetical protein